MFDRSALLDAPAAVVLSHVCGDCSVVFASSRVLRMHRTKKHNQRSDIRYYADSNGVCPVCNACFCSRLRLISHLSDPRRTRFSPQLSGIARLSEARVAELDALDRQAKRLAARDGHTHVLAVSQASSASGRSLGRTTC